MPSSSSSSCHTLQKRHGQREQARSAGGQGMHMLKRCSSIMQRSIRRSLVLDGQQDSLELLARLQAARQGQVVQHDAVRDVCVLRKSAGDEVFAG